MHKTGLLSKRQMDALGLMTSYSKILLRRDRGDAVRVVVNEEQCVEMLVYDVNEKVASQKTAGMKQSPLTASKLLKLDA